MSRHAYFITATDTDAGKTLVAAALLHEARHQGMTTLGLKPIAAGCQHTPDGWRNDDALLLRQHSSVAISYAETNPIALPAPIAPHIAAAQQGISLSAERVAAFCRGSMLYRPDFLLVEGAGGWRLPLNPRESYAAVPQLLQMPVILVVALKLGCINHALLSAEAIQRDGLPLAGWVANQVDPTMQAVTENLQTLSSRLPAPLLGVIPYLPQPSVAAAAEALSLAALLESAD